ncbi:tetratricopeptide repeat protein [Roseiconus lacunae]|uniref:tetratricopeptide repeat protein n=1 Tax=Roseiconus lacunae TaxID=2605694 RepID=UPI003084B211|nr:tetratricopeptide repeat protein [Stieleria sp. HD01]
MRTWFVITALTWTSVWFTPNQYGQRLANQGRYDEAAVAFTDPMRQGVAWYRAGEFDKAAQSFTRLQSAEARYNLGNCWVLLGKYDQAIDSYDDALKEKPDWKEAQENRNLAVARAKLVESPGGEAGDQRLGADEIVFDQNKPPGGQKTEVAGDQAINDATIQAVWLRRVQTKPADFLKAKFAYQNARDTGSDQ